MARSRAHVAPHVYLDAVPEQRRPRRRSDTSVVRLGSDRVSDRMQLDPRQAGLVADADERPRVKVAIVRPTHGVENDQMIMATAVWDAVTIKLHGFRSPREKFGIGMAEPLVARS